MKVKVYTNDKRLVVETVLLEERGKFIILKSVGEIGIALKTEVDLVKYDPIKGKLTFLAEYIGESREYIDNIGYENIYVFALKILEKQEQRRQDVKVKVNIETELKAMSPETGELISINAVIEDISATGIFCTMKKEFDANDQFIYMFSNGKEEFPIVCEILRKIVRDDKEKLYGYGCRFVDLDGAKQNKVREYVFKTELRSRKNNK